jgi:hypothetical protein
MTLDPSRPKLKGGSLGSQIESRTPNQFQKFLKSPKGYVTLLLIILSLFAQLNFQSVTGLRNEIVGSLLL